MKKTIIYLFTLFSWATLLVGAPKKDIVDTAIEAGNFKTLVTAVQKASLVDTLKGEGPYTVFAPTDEAFANFWPDTLKNLLKPENNDKLQMLLTYHVLPGKVKAKKAKKLESAEPLSGGTLRLSVNKKNLFVNSAKVVKADIKTSNGIIHVIDSVLIPNVSKDATKKTSNTHQIIMQAIHKGVPMYNSGHHAQTAAIYMQAGNDILDQCPYSICSNASDTIKTAMIQASSELCPTSQAWIMRHAFDKVLASVN